MLTRSICCVLISHAQFKNDYSALNLNYTHHMHQKSVNNLLSSLLKDIHCPSLQSDSVFCLFLDTVGRLSTACPFLLVPTRHGSSSLEVFTLSSEKSSVDKKAWPQLQDISVVKLVCQGSLFTLKEKQHLLKAMS